MTKGGRLFSLSMAAFKAAMEKVLGIDIHHAL
jgi:hypothetical protein